MPRGPPSSSAVAQAPAQFLAATATLRRCPSRARSASFAPLVLAPHFAPRQELRRLRARLHKQAPCQRDSSNRCEKSDRCASRTSSLSAERAKDPVSERPARAPENIRYAGGP